MRLIHWETGTRIQDLSMEMQISGILARRSFHQVDRLHNMSRVHNWHNFWSQLTGSY
jgi:hypothetical protein